MFRKKEEPAPVPVSIHVTCDKCSVVVDRFKAVRRRKEWWSENNGYVYFCPEHEPKWDERRNTGMSPFIYRYYRNIECQQDGTLVLPPGVKVIVEGEIFQFPV